MSLRVSPASFENTLPIHRALTDSGSALAAALELAGLGWHVFPAPIGKKESHKSARYYGGRRWGATANAEEVRSDFKRWPTANIGVACGPVSGVFVIEADTLEGHGIDGVGNLDRLIAENGGLPKTVEAVSPSGSRHFYFQWSDGFDVRSSVSRVSPGVDVRGDRGMVIVPPSVKPGLHLPYRWVHPPTETSPAACPDWLLRLCMTPERPIPSSLPLASPGFDDEEHVLGWLYTRSNGLGRDDWVKLCLALKGHFGDRARDGWLSFSGRYGDVTPGEAERVWDTAIPSGGVSIGSAVALLGGYERHPQRAPRSAVELEEHRHAEDPGWTEMPDRSDPDYVKTPTSSARLPVIDFTAWSDFPPARESAWGDWLPLRQTTMLTGPGGCGKSLLTQMLSTCIALGLPFLGLETRSMNALYVTAEDDVDELWRRQHSICLSLGVPLSSLAGKLHLVSLAGETDTALATFEADGRMKATDRWRQICDAAEAGQIRFGAFDNATDMMAGDHNDVHQVAAFVNLLTGFAIDQNGVVMILHHPNKGGDDWLGSIAWHNKVRSRLIIRCGEGSDLDGRFIENPKANYGPTGNRIAFRWHEGAFTRDEDLGEDVASQLRKVSVQNAENAAFLACLRQRASEGIERMVGPSTGPNYAPSQFEGMAQAKGYKRAALRAAMDRLFNLGAIKAMQVPRPGKSETKTVIVEVEA